MTDGKRSHLVPRRRFPEFVHLPAWEHTTLQATVSFATGRVPVDQVPLADYISTENLVSDFGGVTTATRQPPSGCATRYQPGDVLVANIRPYLRKVWRADRFGGASNDVIVMRPTKDIDPCFFEHVVKNDAFIAYVMRTAKGVKMPRGDLGSIREYAVFRPTRAEQQKIADCLGSLDDLIAAQDRKLETLRQHKQGLMQQLFPQPGETLPNLRFPEFGGLGDWNATTIGAECESFSGGTPATSKRTEYYGGTIPFIRSAEIGSDETELCLTDKGLANSAAKMVARGDVLIALYGVNSGDTAIAQIDGAINQAIMCLRSSIIAPFLYHYLTARKTWIINTYLQGGQGNLSGQIVLSVPLVVPCIAEQERVASCLSMIDDCVKVQQNRLAHLRRHKAGLLQQLFPSVGESAP